MPRFFVNIHFRNDNIRESSADPFTDMTSLIDVLKGHGQLALGSRVHSLSQKRSFCRGRAQVLSQHWKRVKREPTFKMTAESSKSMIALTEPAIDTKEHPLDGNESILHFLPSLEKMVRNAEGHLTTSSFRRRERPGRLSTGVRRTKSAGMVLHTLEESQQHSFRFANKWINKSRLLLTRELQPDQQKLIAHQKQRRFSGILGCIFGQ